MLEKSVKYWKTLASRWSDCVSKILATFKTSRKLGIKEARNSKTDQRKPIPTVLYRVNNL
jgi:hypothetical protein